MRQDHFISMWRQLQGLTISQIHTNEIPLGHIKPGEFTQLVARDDVRPEPSFRDEAPQLTDPVWHLSESCWAKSPTTRPNANALCDTVSSLVAAVEPSQILDVSEISDLSSIVPSITQINPLRSPQRIRSNGIIDVHSPSLNWPLVQPSMARSLRLVSHPFVWSGIQVLSVQFHSHRMARGLRPDHVTRHPACGMPRRGGHLSKVLNQKAIMMFVSHLTERG